MQTDMKKDAGMKRVEIRITEAQKKQLKQAAADNGMTMTELILLRIKDLPVPDRHYQDTLFQKLGDAAREINAIGNNLNQAVVALHLIKNGHKIDAGDFERFLQLQETYNALLSGLKDYFATLFNETQ